MLRPFTDEDLPLLPGGDSPFDDWGPSRRTEVPGSGLDAPGALVVDDGSVLGMVSWVDVRWGPNASSHNPMIGIWLRPEARGRGVGTQAQRALCDLLFRHTHVNRVEAHTDVDNVAEQRSLESAGFVREGTIRGGQWRDGAYRDGYLYSILRREWLAARGEEQELPAGR